MFVFHLHNIIETRLGYRGATPLLIMYIKDQTFPQKLLQILFPTFPPNKFQIQSNLPYSWGHLYQGSLSQFLWTKNSFSRLSIYNLHRHKLVKILQRESPKCQNLLSHWELKELELSSQQPWIWSSKSKNCCWFLPSQGSLLLRPPIVPWAPPFFHVFTPTD